MNQFVILFVQQNLLKSQIIFGLICSSYNISINFFLQFYIKQQPTWSYEINMKVSPLELTNKWSHVS